MPRKWKKEEYQYQQEYIRDNIKFVSVPFNLRKKDDGELYDHLNGIEEKKATYIKELIRKDMKGATKMMNYKIKPEYIDLWECKDSHFDPDLIITQDEVERLSEEWDTPVEDLIEQLIPVE